VTGAALGLLGLVVGAAAGWLAARRRHPPVADGPAAARVSGPYRVRAADAAAELPPGAKLDTIARYLADRAAEQVSLPCMVVLREVDGGPITVGAVSAGYDSRLVGSTVEPDSWAGRAVTEGVPVVAPEDQPVVPVDPRDRRRPVRGGAAVPIISNSRTEGALLALGETGVPPSDLVGGLEAIARRFAPVLGPAQAVQVAERRANTDELTQLANRRALRRAMEGQEARRSALVMIDLDFFKRINDTLGHLAGDAALKHFAQLLRKALRAGDVAARIGGEEFAVWLPGADLALGVEVAERLRVLLTQSPFRFEGGEHPFTISCGVSACPAPIASPDNLFPTADSALYRAKREGRDRVVASPGANG